MSETSLYLMDINKESWVMESRPSNQSNRAAMMVGGLLIFFGVLSLLGNVLPFFGGLVWAGVLAAGAVVVYGMYLTDRSQWWLLIPAYAMFVLGTMLALIGLGVLRDEWIATFVLLAIGLPFLYVYARNPRNWWAVIPAYAMFVLGTMLALIGLGVLRDEWIATFVLSAIGLPFLYVYARNPRNWWALIPAYTMLAIGTMVGLIGLGLLNDLLIPAYVNLAIALPFFVVFVRDRNNWWALIPGGIMGVIGMGFLAGSGAFNLLVPAVLILGGLFLLARQFIGGRAAERVGSTPTPQPMTGPAADKAPEAEKIEEK
jgi:hypothetical protein